MDHAPNGKVDSVDMYTVERKPVEYLLELERSGYGHTVFTTCAWLRFLMKNQGVEPVVLSLCRDGKEDAVFVGGVIKKAGIRILGSPFEGWLTPDMGFIRINQLDVEQALYVVRNYAFHTLKCWFVQITDKEIPLQEVSGKFHFQVSKLLYLDNSRSEDEVLEGFTKNGRRDVRAFERKGTHIRKVPFDRDFADLYYAQLIDVFAKQGLKPFYPIEKVYDLVDAFADEPDRVLALEACLEDGTCIATVFSFGYRKWGYYMGAASFREHQKYLPNEGLFWAFVRHWNENQVPDLDLVGYRQYKMKYAPVLVDEPTIYFERVPGLLFMKNTARKMITLLRKIRGA